MKGMCLWAQIMKAELSWLYYGPCRMAFYSLLLCNNRKFIAVVIKAIIDVLANPRQSNSVISSVVDDCRQLASQSQIPQVQFSHCFMEVNRCADALTRLGSQQFLDFILYDNPLVDLGTILDSDRVCLYLNRCCPKMNLLSFE